jgi:hypothetical protein
MFCAWLLCWWQQELHFCALRGSAATLASIHFAKNDPVATRSDARVQTHLAPTHAGAWACCCVSRRCAACPVSCCSSRCWRLCAQRVFLAKCRRAQGGSRARRVARASKRVRCGHVLLLGRAAASVTVALRALRRAVARVVGACVHSVFRSKMQSMQAQRRRRAVFVPQAFLSCWHSICWRIVASSDAGQGEPVLVVGVCVHCFLEPISG